MFKFNFTAADIAHFSLEPATILPIYRDVKLAVAEPFGDSVATAEMIDQTLSGTAIGLLF